MLQVCGNKLIFLTGKGQGILQQLQKQQDTYDPRDLDAWMHMLSLEVATHIIF